MSRELILASLGAFALLAACRADHSGGAYRETAVVDAGMILDPPPGWARSKLDGLVWSSVPPATDPLSGQARMTLTLVELPERAGRPSGKLQVAHLIEARNSTLPSGSFQSVAHRTAKYGPFAVLEIESRLVGAGGPLRLRQACFWEGGRQYTLTLTAGEAVYDAASAIFRQVAEAARYEDTTE